MGELGKDKLVKVIKDVSGIEGIMYKKAVSEMSEEEFEWHILQYYRLMHTSVAKVINRKRDKAEEKIKESNYYELVKERYKGSLEIKEEIDYNGNKFRYAIDPMGSGEYWYISGIAGIKVNYKKRTVKVIYSLIRDRQLNVSSMCLKSELSVENGYWEAFSDNCINCVNSQNPVGYTPELVELNFRKYDRKLKRAKSKRREEQYEKLVLNLEREKVFEEELGKHEYDAMLDLRYGEVYSNEYALKKEKEETNKVIERVVSNIYKKLKDSEEVEVKYLVSGIGIGKGKKEEYKELEAVCV